ncbi:unnamed protein product [Rhizoctonia solani]|uniref:DUF7587 domain-containing protein n=1 Tax=Rhizoctonia solani TaxID=456999 RepID=A0A8H3DZU7_9AGAM|nr:unnamed protein product [Rhizoctonia solani]
MLTANSPLAPTQQARHSTGRPKDFRIVFRVFDSTSFRGYDPATGFSATGFDENAPQDYTELLEAHLDPTNRTVITPWLSTTSSWLWALWEMNRRYESRSAVTTRQLHEPNIQVAVIDLAVCRTTEDTTSSTLGPKPIFRPTSRKKNSDTSEEVLIYGKIPISAIVSVWKFEKLFGVTGLPRLYSYHWQMLASARSGEYNSFREARGQLAAVVKGHYQRQAWKATEEGERCASVAITFMKDGYNRLEQQINRMVQPIRSQTDQVTQLAGLVESLSTGTGQELTIPVNDNAIADLRTSVPEEGVTPPGRGADTCPGQDIPSGGGQDATYTILPGDLVGYLDPPIFGAYMSLIAHNQVIKQQILGISSGSTGNPVPSFLARELSHFSDQRGFYEHSIIRIIRQKIELFRAIALEFALTVPIGVLDQLKVDQHDWETMRWFIMGSINAWLAPLERRLDGLEDNTIPEQKAQVQFGWLREERKYQWWRYKLINVEGPQH